jgi:beta-N-acetylhexosaminidase
VTPAGLFLVGVESTALAPAERRLLEEFPPAGVLLFARNVESAPQVRRLGDEIGRLAPEALLFADQEGGAVDRFRAITGPSISFSRACGLGREREAGALAGELCAALSVDVDLAPVVDRAVEGAGREILGERCASEDPNRVAAAAGAFLDGLETWGVAGCLKHFPGLGRAAVDSHRELPAVPEDAEEARLDLAPFVALAPRAFAVMVSHAATSAAGLPASLDPAVVGGLLRGRVGFEGLAISDDLEMGALSAFGPPPERAARAFAAGCDLLCIGRELSALPAAARLIARGSGPARLEEAARRHARFRERLRALRRETRAIPRQIAEITAGIGRLRSEGERV